MNTQGITMKTIITAGLFGAALVLSGCGGSAPQVKAGAPATAQAPCPGCDKVACKGCPDKAAKAATKKDCAKKDCAKKDCAKSKDCAKGKDCAGKDCGDCAGKVAFKMMPAAELAKALEAGTDLHVYDVNSIARYNKGHVKGAKHLNRYAMSADTLPQDKAAKLVFYCGSSRCKASHKAAHKARRLGYTNVAVMPEGIKGWEEATLPTETASLVDPIKEITAAGLNTKRMGAAQIFIYDVNKAARFASSHIPGAVNVGKQVAADKLPPNKNAMLVFYCANARCGASHMAATSALKLGYTNVWVMRAGIKGWEEAKLPVEKASM